MSCVIAGVIFDSTQRFLKKDDETRHLEPKVFALLSTLIEAEGQIVTREQLIVDVWNNRVVGESAINRTVSLLRGHFSALTERDVVETVPTQGYRLVASVEALQSQSDVVIDTASSKRPANWIFALALILIAVIIGGVFAVKQYSPRTEIPQLTLKHGPLIGLKGWEYKISTSLDGAFLLFHHLDAEHRQQVYLYNTRSHTKQIILENALAALSPDGQQVVYAKDSKQCEIYVMDLATRESKTIASCSELPSTLVWGGNNTIYFNKRFSKSHPYQVYNYQLDTSRLQQITNPTSDNNTRGDFKVAAQLDSGLIAILRYVSEEETELLVFKQQQLLKRRSFAKRLKHLAWIPNSEILMVANDHALFQVDNELQLLKELTTNINSLAIYQGANQNHLLLSSALVNSEIVKFDIDSKQQRVWQESGQIELLPRVQKDRKLVLSTRFNNHQWWQVSGQQAQLLDIDLPFDLQFVRYELSSDGKYLVFSKQGSIYEIDLDSKQLHKLFASPQSSYVVNYDVSSDERSVIYSSNHTGQWQLWRFDRTRQDHTQLTEQGGYSGWIWQEYLYYSKFAVDGLWRKRLDGKGSNEELIIKDFDRINWLNWRIVGDNLYFYRPKSGIWRSNLNSGTEEMMMATTAEFVHQYTISPDQKSIYWVKRLPIQGDIYEYMLSQ